MGCPILSALRGDVERRQHLKKCKAGLLSSEAAPALSRRAVKGAHEGEHLVKRK